MRNIPVAVEAVLFICTTTPQPRIANRETGEVKQNKAGQTLYQVGVCAIQTDGEREEASTLLVTVPGEPKGLTRGAPVRFTNLIAMPWEQGDRHGVAYRAEAIASIAQQGRPAAESKAA
jgi:hypothetical protein